MELMSTATGMVMGAAVGAVAVYAATQDKRQMRKTVHKLAKGAEKTLVDLDRMVSHNWRLPFRRAALSQRRLFRVPKYAHIPYYIQFLFLLQEGCEIVSLCNK